MFEKCLITQKNRLPEYNKNVFMALKHCPFPHRYDEEGDYVEIRNESIYETNRESFREIVTGYFEPLNKYGLEIQMKFI